jgi:hypothetical protein
MKDMKIMKDQSTKLLRPSTNRSTTPRRREDLGDRRKAQLPRYSNQKREAQASDYKVITTPCFSQWHAFNLQFLSGYATLSQ